MSDIFLSYKNEDKAKAQTIAEALEQKGYSVWWDKVIPPGRNFDEVIKEELDSAKCVIVLWSKKSVLSDYVKEEADYGKKRRILVPILIEDVDMPIGFGRIQAARLIDWKGTLHHPEFDLLLNSVSGIIGRGETGGLNPGAGKEKTNYNKSLIVIGLLGILLLGLFYPSQTTGSISVSCSPSGAGIYLDGSYQGTTPMTIKSVSAGFHTITLKLTEYQDFSQDIRVDADEIAYVSPSLTYIPISTPITTPSPAPTITSQKIATSATTPPTVAPTTTTPTPTPTPALLTTMTVSPATASVVTGGKKILIHTPKDQFGNPMTVPVIWTSSDTNVGTIDGNGLFNAKASGITTITAASGSVSGTANVTVTINMEFVLIPAGEFDMGSPSSATIGTDRERPVHHVKISSAFYMGKYEVTQKQWRDVMGTNPSIFPGDELPVQNVPWNDVKEFIGKLNTKEGTNKYRLPSEAEWEYAARSGTTTIYYFGDDISKLGDYAWCNNPNISINIVGLKSPNPWGLYDMYGNVWEWVQDTYYDNYNGAPADGSSWESGDSSIRVVRGGSWFTLAPAPLDTLAFALLRICNHF
jgi:formylglycine-generating enzyme required for sulfatase activity